MIETVKNFHFGNDVENPPSWYEPYVQSFRGTNACNRKTVKRNGRLSQYSSLPVVYVSNLRSILPKINNFKTDVKERKIDICLLSEVWEKRGNKKYINEVVKMMEIEGLKYISTPRSFNKRGGGCALVANLNTYSLEKINVLTPKSLEVVYGLLRPKTTNSSVKEIVAIAFYSPPKSRKKNELIDHIVTNLQILMAKYPEAGILIGGDRNEMSITPILNAIPRTKQIVTRPTCNGKTLDILITNLHELYCLPNIVPAVPADDLSAGVPSDHSIVIAAPICRNPGKIRNEYTTKTTRPLPDSEIRKFGQWIVQHEWETVNLIKDPSEQVQLLQNTLSTSLEKFLPAKTVKFSKKDKKWMNGELKKIDRLKKREWCKNGKSLKYIALKKKFDTKFKDAAKKFAEKNVTELMEENPGKAYSTLRRMGAKPGDDLDDTSFVILEHLEKKLTSKESVELIANHFSKISQEFPAISVSNLSQGVQLKLQNRLKSKLPFVTRWSVKKMLMKAKKSKSGIQGDLPKQLVNEFCHELSEPLSSIYNNIIRSGQWPNQWKTEFGLPLKKVDQPVNEDEIRIISLTPLYSKVFEKFVMEWLLHYLKDKIDCFQYGGQTGNSVSHYLIDFINFVSYNQDIKDIQAVLAITIDFSKAFNRQNHLILVELLSELGIPGWLLQIIIGFLENRELEVFFNGVKSKRKKLPGGGPQGTILGMFLFLILINQAGFKNLVANTGKIICNPSLSKQKPMRQIHLKWIDDMTVAESIDLKNTLETDPNLLFPLQYHERTGHYLPSEHSKLQTLLNDLVEYTAL